MAGLEVAVKAVDKVAEAVMEAERIGNKIADLNGIPDVNASWELVGQVGGGIKGVAEISKSQGVFHEADALPEEMPFEAQYQEKKEQGELSEAENACHEADALPEEMPFEAQSLEKSGCDTEYVKEAEADSDSEGMAKKDDAEKNRMEPPVKIVFICREKYDKTEYERQVKNQEKGMNTISLYDYVKNRESYKENGRNREIGDSAQDKARQEARADRIAENRQKGMSREEAELEANQWLETQTALHDPDQIAGGDAANVVGMGDKDVNSSIGSQWKNRIDAVDAAVQRYIEANKLGEEDWKNVYLNVNLEVAAE